MVRKVDDPNGGGSGGGSAPSGVSKKTVGIFIAAVVLIAILAAL